MPPSLFSIFSKAAFYLYRSPLQWGLLLLVVALCLLPNLEAGEPSLMEARNFVTAREMVQQGHWLVPTMNGQIRLAKPPLPTWITAAAGLAYGDMEHLAALRFPAALMAALLVFFTYLLARQLTSDRLIPFLAAMVLATSLTFVQVGRQGTWDIYCHSFMCGGIWLLVRGWRCQTGYGTFIAAGILLGCSFLSKGPVSFYALLLPFLLAWYRGYGSQSLGPQMKKTALALLVGMLLALSWPLYVFVQVPREFLASGGQEASAWLERHVRPIWFYWSFPAETGIWTLFAAASLAIPYARPRVMRFGNYRFLVTWVLMAVILLSVIPEKKERYLFPVLVPMALLTGHYLRYLIAAFPGKNYTTTDLRLVASTCGLLVLATAAGPYLLYRFVYQPHYSSGLATLAASAWILLLGAAIVFFFHKGRLELLVLVMAGLQVTVFVMGISPYYSRHPIHHNYRSLRAVRHLKAVHHLPLYAYGGMSMEQVWEVGQPVDSFRLEAPALLPPKKLPLALFAPAPLDPAAFRAQQMDLRHVQKFHYRRDEPAAVYYLYILTPLAAPANGPTAR